MGNHAGVASCSPETVERPRRLRIASYSMKYSPVPNVSLTVSKSTRGGQDRYVAVENGPTQVKTKACPKSERAP